MNRLGQFFDIGVPVVTNVLAGIERELRGGVSGAQMPGLRKRQALSSGGMTGS